MPQSNFNTHTSEKSKSQKYQTHLTKEFEKQQQTNIRLKKKHIVTNQYENGWNQQQTKQAKPISQREECFKHLSKWQETFIKQGKWDKENETHTFSWRFWEEMKQQKGSKMETRWEWVWAVERDNEQSQKVRGKNWKRFKNCLNFSQTRVFRDWSESPHSRRFMPPKHSKTKVWKIFLSVFRDWKVYPRGSRELSRENLWVILVIGPSTRE